MLTSELMICQICGKETEKRSSQQKYCVSCSKKAAEIRKKKWYEKNKIPKEDRICCICGDDDTVWKFRGENYYCKKHYYDMYRFGEIKDLNGRRKKNEYRVVDGYVEFKTTRGLTAYIDYDDIYLIHDHYWGMNSQGYLHSRINGKLERMHRYIMNPQDGELDHINRNKLDNRKCNLRISDRERNGRNLSLKTNNTSGVAGVSKIPSTGKWKARISINRKEINLGHYDDFNDAVTARRLAEIEHFGEYAPDWND